MTAISFCLNKQRHDITSSIIESMHLSNKRYGRDAENIQVLNHVGMSYQGFWTTPEEQGESQPIQKDNRFYLLFDGRIDNRTEIYSKLNQPKFSLDEYSDASLFLALFSSFNNKEDLIKNVIGSYAYIIFDSVNNSVIAGRDTMGGRMLAYAENDKWLCISTTVHSINAHDQFKFILNERTVAQQFAYLYLNDDSTFSSNVKQVLPGHSLSYGNGKLSVERRHLLDSSSRVTYKNHHEYTDQFKQLFTDSVSARLRTSGPVASMVSGGLDSLPITLCAKDIVGDAKQIHGVTWSFDELTRCDERPYFRDIFKEMGIHLEEVNCDDAYPFNKNDNWQYRPDNPLDMPFRGKHQRAYHRIKSLGAKVCLSGMAGDDLYAGTDLIFWEIIRAGKPISAIRELNYRFKHKQSTPQFLKQHFLWYTRLWYAIKGPKTLYPDYLTEKSKALISEIEDVDYIAESMIKSLRPKQYRQLQGTYWPNNLTSEKYFANEYDVEVRYPLRDRRLCEFMLGIPSDHLQSLDVKRPIVKEAFRDLLPSKVINRNNKTGFIDLLVANKEIWNNGLNKDLKLSNSSKYVKFDILRKNTSEELRSLVLTLHAVYFDQWLKYTRPNRGVKKRD